MDGLQISRVILYVKDIPKVAAFYQRVFDLRPLPGSSAGWLELAAASGGCSVALHQASVKQKSGAAMKLVFGTADVKTFLREKDPDGKIFGVVHAVEGFEFSNGKDPAGNSVSISSRGFGEKR